MKLSQLLWLFISFFGYSIKLSAFIDKYLERQIELYDLFDSVKSFINYKNKKRDNVFELGKKSWGLEGSFELVGFQTSLMSIF